MWADFDSENGFPNKRPLLAHYTSISVFEQMMANEEVWFSNPLYMNDFEELRFGMLEGASAFRESQELRQSLPDEKSYTQLMGHFNQFFHQFDTQHAFHTYVMCLSKHDPNDSDGRLSMWRGYGAGGAGMAIVFNTAKIEANPESPLIVGPVHYASSQERVQWIAEKIKALASLLRSRSVTDEDLFYLAFHWIERLKTFSLFTKHIGFREEDEWRIVYMNERDPKKLLKDMYSYAITPKGVEPKLKLKVKPLEGMFSQDLSFNKIIDRVILGPTNSSALATHVVKRILEQTGKDTHTIKIQASSIPFRL